MDDEVTRRAKEHFKFTPNHIIHGGVQSFQSGMNRD